MQTLKEKTISGLLWSTVERFGYMFTMFISNLFLARLLSPNDFGTIAMIMVFISVSSIIVDSGFGAALIQKKEVEDIDYSTVFYFNILLAILLYITLFLVSPSIAQFYENEALTTILRVLGLVLIFNSLSIVQLSRLKRELNFKLISVVSIVSSILGCCVGVYAAFAGYGVWSLVAQSIVISVIRSIMLFILVKWYPILKLSFASFKSLFNFGSMILLSNLVDTLYANTIPLITGKFFSPKVLGDYTQARTLEGVPNQTLISIVGQVTFPIFSKFQDDHVQLKLFVRKSMKSLVWVNFPIMIILVIIAEPLIILLYTDKWIDAIPIFQIACLGGMLQSTIQINNMILSSLGHSKLYFISRFVKQVIGITLIVFGITWFGLDGMLIFGILVAQYIFVIISVFFTKKVFNYGFIEQLRDIVPTFVLSIVVGVITYCTTELINIKSLLLDVLISTIIYGVLYILLSALFKNSTYNQIKNELIIRLKKIIK